MKKILWMCDPAFSDEKMNRTGTWLQPLAEMLQQSGKVQICNIAQGNVTEITESNCRGIHQWIIPSRKRKRNGLIPSVTCEEIKSVEKQVNPDLVHIWGTENIWATVYRNGYIASPVLIDMQGLLSVYADFYYGGLTFFEILQCIHFKEIILPWRTIFHKKKIFEDFGRIETENLKCFRHISYQSEWVKSQVSLINPEAKYHAAKMMLRDAFYKATPWQYKEAGNAPVIFSSCSWAVTYKGIHMLIKAVGILKKKYPKVKLNLAGYIDVGNKWLDGYSIYLKKLIKKWNLEDNICLLGPLDAHQIIEQMQNSHVCAVPSFIETYCLAFAEALMVGVPVVVSFAGAMPELAEHRKSALFYNSIDYRLCAAYMDELIQNRELAESLSCEGRKTRLINNDPATVVGTQLSIYECCLEE